MKNYQSFGDFCISLDKLVCLIECFLEVFKATISSDIKHKRADSEDNSVQTRKSVRRSCVLQRVSQVDKSPHIFLV